MRRKVFKPSRIVATLASLLTAISSIALSPVTAQAAQVGSGSCITTVDNSSGVTSYYDGTYCYLAFKSTGITYNWTRPDGVTSFDYLVVAGGGSGAVRHAGGGGAGGLIQATSQTITAATISVTVGAGGAAAGAQASGVGAEGVNGSNSVVSASGFTTQTAIGGGAGSFNVAPSTGGSGGGGGTNYTGAASSAAGQGNSGGGGFNSGLSWYGGGGGGGAGTTGGSATNATLTTAGSGGNGVSISWISTTVQASIGVGAVASSSVYFAGGGGGSTSAVGTGGGGGLGGGGAGGSTGQAGTSGAANTGGGGGAGAMNATGNTSQAAGSGGSGVVVFRYSMPAPILSWNASDVNSYEETVSTTAINDLSSSSANDGVLYTGTNGVAPGFDRTTGAWTFSGGNSSTGPYAKVSTNISTAPFNASGVTIDFEADFGTQVNAWERIIDFSSNGAQSDNLLVARNSTSSDMTVEVYNGSTSFNYCTLPGAIASGMNRWTIRLDGTNCVFYKNGVLQNSYAYAGRLSATATWTNAFIGKSNWSSDSTLEGSVRSLRLFAGAYSAAQIPAPSTKTVTLNAYDGNAVNGGGVTNNMQSPRLTTGSVRLPTPITRAGYTFTGWYDATTFANKVGDAGAIYTPSSTITLYGGWRTSIDSTALGNLVFNFDATHIDSLPVAATSAASVYPASSRMLATAVGGLTRDTANSPGSAKFLNRSFLNFGANNAANITTTPLTVETWFKCNSYRGAGWNIIATHWFSDVAGNSTTAVNDWHFGIYNNHLQLNSGSANNISIGSYTFTNSDCDGTKWMLLGFTFDSSGNVQFYINGRADGVAATGKTRQPNTSAILMMGDQRDAASILGYMSRFRMYNSALSSSQMLNTYSAEAVTYGMGPYTLTYKAGPNGTGSDVVETYNAGLSATLKNNDAPFTRAGYYISGWTTSSVSGAAQTHALASTVSMDANLILYPVWTATTYTITYNYNGATGGNGTASATYAAGGSAITLPTPTKTSYTFGGWWSTSTFDTGTQVTGTQTPSSSFTLYAKWTLVQYTLTFKANDGLSTADITQTVNAGVAVNLRTNTFSKSHASFGNWSDVSTGMSMNSWTDGQSITPTSNMTFYAIWRNDARVIFDSLGGSAVADAYTIGQPLAGATPLAKPADPTKAGKIFGGWSTAVANSNGVAVNIVSWPADLEMNSTATYYAIWLDACSPTKTTFVGSGTSDLTSPTYGTNGVKYIQLRYNTVGQCAFTVPSEVSALDVLMVGGGGAGSFYARAGGGGAGALLHTTTPYSVSAGAIIPITVGSGGAFVSSNGSRGEVGGYSAFANFLAQGGGAGAGGSGTVQAASAGASGGGGACTAGYTAGGAGGTVSYSGWQAYAGSGGNATYADCTVSGGAGGGGAGGSVANGVSTGGASLTRYGIELAGGGAAWWPSATRQGGGNVGGDWTNNGCATSTPNDGVANTGSGGGACGSGASGTVIVRYAAPTYTTTYSYNSATGGNSVASADYVDTAITLPTPTRTGYTFGGWYAEAGLTTLVGNAGASYTPSSDTTLYAKWTGGTYTLTYNYNGATAGNGTTSSAYTTGGTAITLPTPTRTGYTFAGWYAESNFVTSISGAQTPSADATIYAKWTGLTYTVTYNYNGADGSNSTVSSSYTSGGAAVVLPGPTRNGYGFNGWYTDFGFTNYVGIGSGSYYPTGDTTLYAKWNAYTYTMTFQYNGATGGNGTASSNYTSGGTAITLPTPTKTGYTFGGWFAENTFVTQLVGTQTLTSSTTVYAKWSATAYAINFSPNYGVQASSTTNVAPGSATVLPTQSRANFVFDGWWTASTGGTKVGDAGASYTPSAAGTLYARWIQASLYGVVNNLNRISTITASDLVASTYSGATGGSGVSVSVPTGTLPAGTVVALDVITDTTYAQSLLTGTNNYILSIAVSWLAPDETVPNTNTGKSISMTITNSSIRAGALVYSVQNGVVTLLGTATQNGTITVQLTSDPSLYVVATVPSIPNSVTSTASGTSATVTWSSPTTDGGSIITGYTVTLTGGASCTTTTLSCVFNNLAAGSYTATVIATNAIGNSMNGTTSFSLGSPQQSGGSTPIPPVTPTPPVVVPPKPVDPVVPSKPVLIRIPLVKAVEKVLAHNVPVLTGSPVISPILFAPNSAKLDAFDLAMIKQAAAALKDKSGWLFVTGFVKYEGKGTAIERKIANARATVVASQLAKLGLKVKIGYLGYGTPNKKSPKPTDRKVELRWVQEASQIS